MNMGDILYVMKIGNKIEVEDILWIEDVYIFMKNGSRESRQIY